MRHITAIVLAAGKGLRFKSKIPKPLVKINSKPIIIYSLKILSEHPLVTNIIIVVNRKNKKEIINKIRRYHINKINRIAEGGKHRQDSVYCGLKALDSCADLVLIHDAVRPFINKDIISSLIKAAEKSGAAILGVPVKATIKSVKVSLPVRQAGKCQSLKEGLVVEKTLDRDSLWEIQTPQVFKKDLILKAYKRFGDLSVTDDAMLVEKLGAKVSVVRGSYNNIKITTPEDLILAQAIA